MQGRELQPLKALLLRYFGIYNGDFCECMPTVGPHEAEEEFLSEADCRSFGNHHGGAHLVYQIIGN